MKRFTNFAVWLVIVFCSFYFWAHLSVTTSVLLAFFFSAALDRASDSTTKPTFMPHMVKFNPHVYQMLLDLKLVTPERWKEAFAGQANTDPWSGDYVCRFGLWAYGLLEDAEGNTVVHWPKLGIYSEGFSASIELNNFPQFIEGSGSAREWLPRLVIRRTMKGYGIGIEVLSDWWDLSGSKLPSVVGLQHDTDYMIGRTVVYLSHFPHQPLWEFSTTRTVTKPEAMTNILEASGWKEPDSAYRSEIAHLHPPTTYQHKYADIDMNYIHHIR